MDISNGLNLVLEILKEAFLGSMSSMWGVIKIVIPLMLIIEIIKDLKILDRLYKYIRPLTKVIGTSEKSVLPLLSGILFGIVYGAGLIIESIKEGDMHKKEVYLVGIFLSACHAIVEDTLVFVQIGANGWIVLGVRILMALIVTISASKSKYFKLNNNFDVQI